MSGGVEAIELFRLEEERKPQKSDLSPIRVLTRADFSKLFDEVSQRPSSSGGLQLLFQMEIMARIIKYFKA